ncbi:Siderophore iron transporter 3 [Vanrija pseudolonga]|uniref:Siderophore iron transporter 3 n=1 Tax=Vanrija pseudolonga TaxID=143232 RepID=A0AAF0Y4C5_9TREE|nr:Siderophore iron transporter 3 [Vanrija pseudolonga]
MNPATADPEKARPPSELSDEDKSKAQMEEYEQGMGVTKIEALLLTPPDYVFGRGWKLVLLWFSIGLIAYVYALSQSTTSTYQAFATSAFGKHTIVGTIAVITGIMSAVAQPFIAKLADLLSRPFALAAALVLYTVGYIMVAAAPNITTVVAGRAVYTLGQTGISRVQDILVADITSLQWRGAVSAATSLPFVVNAFVAGYITQGIGALSQNGWRWGYGMFAILVPVSLLPTVLILFWGGHKAKQLGALSLASSSYARRHVLEQMEPPNRSLWETVVYYWVRIDGLGLLLIGFSFAGLLAPATLKTTAKGGYKNPSLIALLVVGGVLFIAFIVWEFRFASHPIMPRRVMNRTFLCCIAIDFLYYFSGFLVSAYYDSWVYIIKPHWSDKNYTYFTNTMTVGLCGFAVFAGLILRYTHRYKLLQISGLCLRVLGEGIAFLAVNGNQSDVVLVMSRIIIAMGGAITVTSTQVASQGSVPHADMALAMAILSLWTKLGGSIASAISAEVWNREVPKYLAKYLGDTHSKAELAKIFGSIVTARAAEPHDLVIKAYTDAFWGLHLGALVVSVLALVAGLLTREFHLGEAHNTVETDKIVRIRDKDEVDEEQVRRRAEELEAKLRREIEQERATR